MAKKSDYERGWYDCYKKVRTLFAGSMKEMVNFRTPSEGAKSESAPKQRASGDARRQKNGDARRQSV